MEGFEGPNLYATTLKLKYLSQIHSSISRTASMEILVLTKSKKSNSLYVTWRANTDIWRFSPLNDLTCRRGQYSRIHYHLKFSKVTEVEVKSEWAIDHELTVRMAENDSVTESAIDAWTSPWAWKTFTVDLLNRANKFLNIRKAHIQLKHNTSHY